MAVSTKAIRDLLMPGLLEVATEQERAKDMANLKWPPRDPKDEALFRLMQREQALRAARGEEVEPLLPKNIRLSKAEADTAEKLYSEYSAAKARWTYARAKEAFNNATGVYTVGDYTVGSWGREDAENFAPVQTTGTGQMVFVQGGRYSRDGFAMSVSAFVERREPEPPKSAEELMEDALDKAVRAARGFV